jgi:hypothetical protein
MEKEPEIEKEWNTTKESEKKGNGDETGSGNGAEEDRRLGFWQCGEKKEFFEDAVRMTSERVSWQDREECYRIIKGIRVYILRKCTSEMNSKKEGPLVPVLFVFKCKSKKERLEIIVKKVGFIVSF